MEFLDSLETGFTPGVFGPKETQVHITVGDARTRECDVPVPAITIATNLYPDPMINWHL